VFERGDRITQHLPVRRSSSDGEIATRAGERELDRLPSVLTVAFLRGQRPPELLGALGFSLLEFHVLAFESPRHDQLPVTARMTLQCNIGIMALCRWRASLVTAAVIALSFVAACGSRGDYRDDSRPNATPAVASPQPPVASRARIVVLGDSLTAGLGLAPRESYPTLLQERLNNQDLNFEIVNAGVSGDTSSGGLSRLDWALEGDVRILVVALGGNDGLRGLPPEQLQQNLARIIERAQARHIEVILAGMEAPPNYGRDYIVSFHKVYPALAQKYGVTLVPFLLQGVAGTDKLNQPDGIHPTATGARIVADNVWAALEPVARRVARPGS